MSSLQVVKFPTYFSLSLFAIHLLSHSCHKLLLKHILSLSLLSQYLSIFHTLSLYLYDKELTSEKEKLYSFG